MPGVAAIYVNYNADCTFTMSVDGGITAAPNATVPPGVYQLLVWLPNPNQGYACGTPTFTFTGPGVSSTTVFRGQELHDEHVIPALQAGATYVASDASAPDSTRHVLTVATSGSSSSLIGSGADHDDDVEGIEPVRPRRVRHRSLPRVAARHGHRSRPGDADDRRQARRLAEGRPLRHQGDRRRPAGRVLRAAREPQGGDRRRRQVHRQANQAGHAHRREWTFFAKAGRATVFAVT